MHYLGRLFFVFVFVLISFTFVNKVQAATCTWTGGAGDGLIHTAGNWSGCTPGLTPQPTDTVVINTGSAAISWTSSASSTIGALTLGSGYTGTLTVSRALTVTNTLTVTSGTFSISDTYGVGVGSLTIDGGTVAIGTGTFSVSGSSSGITSGSLTSSASGILSLNSNFSVALGATVSAGDLRTLNTGTIGGAGTFTAGTLTLSHGTTGHSTTTLGGNLTVSGNCLLNTSAGVKAVLKLSTNTLSCGGTLNLLSSLVQNAAAYLHVESGTLTVTGLTTLNASGALASTTVLLDGGTGDVNLNGGLTIANGPFLPTAHHNAHFYSGSEGTLTIGGNLVLRNASGGAGGGTVLFDGGGKTINISGAILAEAITTDAAIFNAGYSGTLTVSGTSTIFKVEGTTSGASTTFNGQSKNLVFTNGVTVEKTSGSGEVFYTPSTSSNAYDFTLNKAGGYLSFATTSVITGGLTNTAGTLYINGTTTVTGDIANADTILSSTYPLKKTSSLVLDRDSYTLGTHSSLTVTLTDLNRNTVGTTSQSIIVNVITGADAEPLTLTETGVATGIFSGSLSLSQTTPTAGNGTLEANESTTISVSYTDDQDSADTGSDSANASTASSGSGAVIFFGGSAPLTISGTGSGTAITSTSSPSQTIPTIPNEPTPITGSGKIVTGPFAFGYEGEQVKILQEMLAKDSTLYPEALITGYYGPLTKKAVGRFQERYGLAKPSDDFYGLAGPLTRAKINEILGKTLTPPNSPNNQNLIEELQKQIEVLQNQVATLLQKKLLELQNQLPQ